MKPADQCGGGFPLVKFVKHPDGSVSLTGMDERAKVVWTAKGARCPACGRDVLIRNDKSGLMAHAWELRVGGEKVGADSQTTRAGRAFSRTRGSR
jgi:hypothetical protein